MTTPPSITSAQTQILSPPYVYATIVRSLPIGFSLVNEEGAIVEFNPAAEEITGLCVSRGRGPFSSGKSFTVFQIQRLVHFSNTYSKNMSNQ